MFKRIGRKSNVKKDTVGVPMFKRIGYEFQYLKGKGRNSNV